MVSFILAQKKVLFTCLPYPWPDPQYESIVLPIQFPDNLGENIYLVDCLRDCHNSRYLPGWFEDCKVGLAKDWESEAALCAIKQASNGHTFSESIIWGEKNVQVILYWQNSSQNSTQSPKHLELMNFSDQSFLFDCELCSAKYCCAIGKTDSTTISLAGSLPKEPTHLINPYVNPFNLSLKFYLYLNLCLYLHLYM